MSTTASGFFKPQARPWWQHREVSLNWLALGLLLAAWNAVDNDASDPQARRPASLRRHPTISVREAQRHAELQDAQED